MASKTPRETELKWGLSSKEALTKFITGVGEAKSSVVQTNHFFDTERLSLDAVKHTFRLRKAGERFVVTLKGPGSATGNLDVRPEVEWDVPSDAARAALAPGADPRTLIDLGKEQLDDGMHQVIDRLLAPAGDNTFVYVGKFENTRFVVATNLQHDGEVLPANFEVDTTTFEGALEQYEVELEVPEEKANAYEAAAKELFASLGIKTMKNPTKAKRFFDLVKKSGALAT